MVDLEIRPARPADAAAIAAVHVRSWDGAYRELLPDEVLDAMTVEVRTASWRAWLAPDQAAAVPTIVAVAHSEIAGFATLALPGRDPDADDETAELAALYVDPPCWSNGVGGALMDASLERLADGEWRSLTLWVLPDNARAIDFYERRGFAADGATNAEHHGRKTIRLRRPLAEQA